MRERLKAIVGVRARFRGTFSKFGERTSHGYVKRMALLVDVTDSRGREMCDHLWLNLTPTVERLALQPGDVIEFDARVRPYVKGYYTDRRRDYKLNNPTNFLKLGAHDARGNGPLFRDAFEVRA
jgi:signal peptidase I